MNNNSAPKASHRRPPAGRPFEKGQSGNPRGRPRKASSLGVEVRQALAETVEAREKGKTRQISKRKATAKRLANASASGDLRAIKLAAELEGRAEAAEKGAGREALGPDDQEIIERLVARIRQGWVMTEEPAEEASDA